MVGISRPSYHGYLTIFSQGHLLELKLAAIQSIPYEEFVALFGKGHHPSFRALLDSKIAPLLSSIAYQFWCINDDAFSSSFYLRGYSGWALRVAQYIFKLAGVSEDVVALCNSDTLAEQDTIWREKLRPVILNSVVVALLKNPVFCWNALGVPLNQRRMLLNEGTAFEFVKDTLDSLASTYSFKNGAYFYLLVSDHISLWITVFVSKHNNFRLYWDIILRRPALLILRALDLMRSRPIMLKPWMLSVYTPIRLLGRDRAFSDFATAYLTIPQRIARTNEMVSNACHNHGSFGLVCPWFGRC